MKKKKLFDQGILNSRLLRLSRLVRYVSQWEEVYVSIFKKDALPSLKLPFLSGLLEYLF